MATSNQTQDDRDLGSTSGQITNSNSASAQTGSVGQKQSNSSQATTLGKFLRLENPLSNFSSYTYQLTFYIITPACFNYFSETGELSPFGGWYIVAQSGGIGDQEPRATTISRQFPVGTGQGLDYYIDDFSIITWMLGSDGSKTATANSDVSFKIIEPTGFTLLTKLQRTNEYINGLSDQMLNNLTLAQKPTLYQQHYMIGIKFYGYGPNGELMESQDIKESNKSLNDKYGLFERIFPITLTEFNFKIDGGATVYNCQAVVTNLQAGFSVKRGQIKQNMELEGTTLKDIIGSKNSTNKKSLISQLNEIQIQYKEKNQIIETPEQYDVEWLDGVDVPKEKLENSLLVNSSEYSQQTAAMSNALKVEQVNPKEEKNNNQIKTFSKITGIGPGTNIAKQLDNLIVKSNYIADTLNKKVSEDIESKAQTETQSELTWYVINPVVKIIGRDKDTKDWVYNITYQIKPYKIPYIRSQYVGIKTKYYGPVKEYNYFFTGKNTEIVNFEMTFNNLFYQIQSATTNKASTPQSSTDSQIPTRPASGGLNSDATGNKQNQGSVIEENVRAVLYSIGDIADIKFRILGDPDFLMQSIGTKIPSSTLNHFLDKNMSISPYAGQIFIEVIFKVAEDYKDNGLLDLDQEQMVAFYPFDKQRIIKNKGLIYKLNKVTSTFSRGKFEQDLEAFLVPFSDLIFDPDKEKENNREEKQEPFPGRSTGIGGATAEEITRYQEDKRNKDPAFNAKPLTGTDPGSASSFGPTLPEGSNFTTDLDDQLRVENELRRRIEEREALAERIREANRAASVAPPVNRRTGENTVQTERLTQYRRALNQEYRRR
jgi:hypothetical protein